MPRVQPVRWNTGRRDQILLDKGRGPAHLPSDHAVLPGQRNAPQGLANACIDQGLQVRIDYVVGEHGSDLRRPRLHLRGVAIPVLDRAVGAPSEQRRDDDRMAVEARRVQRRAAAWADVAHWRAEHEQGVHQVAEARPASVVQEGGPGAVPVALLDQGAVLPTELHHAPGVADQREEERVCWVDDVGVAILRSPTVPAVLQQVPVQVVAKVKQSTLLPRWVTHLLTE
mmetsp:Transcript_46645/g.129775  ORF Transcript_46645/g.129775 Transcript_46645/m.129775 type:complete len:227 (+) Transcript_46645:614-1294(+)